ncbi:YqgE/AlgH family protein [Sodalis-like secondary symbiont of Drepanosiphum platanoidis]|uniref:YqgE/AlgH family protein n=1 Tax=Sodalis-like secondary symbiont of Drepanosiphum platanoidis TaxID=2994493 RepID=UPI003463EA79
MNLQHHFLIAMPLLQDPLFKKSVIYICEHNNDNIMGIIINKPLEKFTINDIIKKLSIIPSKNNLNSKLNYPVFSGGPLSDERGFILHTPCNKFNSSINISSDTMITTSKDVLESIGTKKEPKNILVALGYSGWNTSQLERELLENSWLTIPANNNILFKTPIAYRWIEAAKILGIDINKISNQLGHA